MNDKENIAYKNLWDLSQSDMEENCVALIIYLLENKIGNKLSIT
jgi:hypothetical protein